MSRVRQRDRVYKYMQDFGSITSAQAFTDLGVMDLPKAISDLRMKDMHKDIVQRRVETKNRYGDATHYNIYSLEK